MLRRGGGSRQPRLAAAARGPRGVRPRLLTKTSATPRRLKASDDSRTARRNARAALRSEWEQHSGRRTGRTPFEDHAALRATRRLFDALWAELRGWAKRRGSSWNLTPDDNEGLNLAEAVMYGAAVEHARPRSRKGGPEVLPRLDRLLRGWQRLAPGLTRPPLPALALALTATHSFELAGPSSPHALLTMLFAHLHQGTARSRRAADLAAPSGAPAITTAGTSAPAGLLGPFTDRKGPSIIY